MLDGTRHKGFTLTSHKASLYNNKTINIIPEMLQAADEPVVKIR